MNSAVSLALYGWVPFVAIVFACLAPARAVIVSYLVGWLFLPVATFQLFGFFDYSKSTAVPLVIFAAIVAFDSGRLLRFRPSWVDLPIALFCFAPMASSISNGLGAHDALSAAGYQTITWGLPYLTGRLYYSSPQGVRQLAMGLLAGGLIYVPLCLWEIRMSPQLHATLYGFHQHNFGQTLRAGGYRPMVFMDHGLMLGLWMSAATVVGLALWTSGAVRRIWGIPLSVAVPVLMVTTLLCKSFGALVLLLAGFAVLWTMRAFRTSLPMALLVCLPPTYVAARTVGAWSGSEMTELVAGVDSDRADSLAFRLGAEEKLRVKAAEKPLFGWGGWGRSLVRRFADDRRLDTVTTDSMWIIVFGKYGSVGLASLLLSFVLPVLVLWRHCPPRLWSRSEAVFAWALAMVLTMYALDSLVNAMANPVYLLIAGGVCGLAPALARAPASTMPARAMSPAAAGV